MSKSEHQYSPLGWPSTLQESPLRITRNFFLGFITALFMTFLGGMAFQLFMPSCKTVTVSNRQLTHKWPAPPPYQQVAKVARYIVHNADWATVSTISSAEPIKGNPFGSILSISDGPETTSSGIPYMYMTPLDFASMDIEKDARVSMTMSEAQSDYCRTHKFDPEDPRCARALLTGTIQKVEKGTPEAEFARDAVFSRHPEMKFWPAGHHWYFVKLNITHIYIFDFFGGAKDVPVGEYYEAEL